MSDKVCTDGGWTNSCKALHLRRSGLYDCKDCGLVFSKLSLSKVSPSITQKCTCKQVTLSVRWAYEDFFDYECPIQEYQCEKCQRVYSSPHHSGLAPLEKQKSGPAERHVLWVQEYQRKEHQKAREAVQGHIEDLKESLDRLPKKERDAFLKKLIGQ